MRPTETLLPRFPVFPLTFILSFRKVSYWTEHSDTLGKRTLVRWELGKGPLVQTRVSCLQRSPDSWFHILPALHKVFINPKLWIWGLTAAGKTYKACRVKDPVLHRVGQVQGELPPRSLLGLLADSLSLLFSLCDLEQNLYVSVQPDRFLCFTSVVHGTDVQWWLNITCP